VVFYDLQHASSAKPLQWLGLIVLFSHMREVQREAKDINDIFGHREQILF
jgi:hypothetical protein